MKTHITLGADRLGQVYGLEIREDGRWKHNSIGYSTSCDVIRPVTKADYEYLTEDPESFKEWWQQAVIADRTEKGLDDWIKEIDVEELIDTSGVFELLEDNDNPTVKAHAEAIRARIDALDDGDEAEGEDEAGSSAVFDRDGQFMPFRRRVELSLLECDKVSGINSEDDVYEWESSGWFPPTEPFVVEFAPRELLDEYYEHLRNTCEEFKG